MVSLRGEVHPWARPEFDRGEAPSNLSGHLLLTLKRSPQQEAALKQLLAAQKDPKSPYFHKWLTPKQFAARFGVADADVQTVTGYLASQGMRVDHVYSNMAVDVEATADQIHSSFNTAIHAYSIGGKTFYANSSAPQIPSALSGVVRGFASLNNFRSSATYAAGNEATFDPKTHTLHPMYSTGVSSPIYGVAPADLTKIYDIPAATDSRTLGGKNVKIGVIGDSNINVSYVNNYRSFFGLGSNPPIVVIDGDDPGINNDAYIAYKQLELVSAVAPNAQVYYYTSATTSYDAGINFALLRAVSDDNVQVLLIGYQECETALGSGDMALISAMEEQAAAQGITVVAAAGDTGSDACAIPGTSGSLAGAAYAVNGYASSSYVTAVGGTDFYYGLSSASSYWGTTAANGYIPEQAWNDSAGTSNVTTGNSVQLAGGGGASTAGDGVSTPVPIPSYQTSVVPSSVGGGTARVIPDVSFFAGSGANNTGGYNSTAYLFCMQPTDCQTGSKQFTYSGGTAAAAAVMAGAVALAVEHYNSGSAYGLGNINPELYNSLTKKTTVHNDVPGSSVPNSTNALACSSGANCSGGKMTGFPTLKVGSGSGYSTTGYDAATGWGSLDITSFATTYAPTNTTASKVTLTVIDPTTGAAPKCGTTPNCTTHSTNLQFTINAASSSGTGATPTGDVAILTTSPLASQTAAETLTLSGGQATDTWNLLPGGTYNIYARYAGDNTYAASVSNSVPITVKPEACQMVTYGGNVNTTTATTIPYGAPVNITVEPYSAASTANVSIASGSIQVTDGGKLITTIPLNSEGSATFNSNLLAIGSHSIKLTYTGDASFSSPGCSAGPFLANVTAAGTVTTLNPSSAALNGGSITLTAEVEAATLVVNGTTYPSTGIPPSGTITFKDGSGKTLGTGSLVSGFDANGNAMGAASISITSVPSGGTVTAVYGGSGNYAGSTSAAAKITTSSQSIIGLSATTTSSFTITDADGVTNSVYPNQDSLTLNVSVKNGTGEFLGFIPIPLPATTEYQGSTYGTVSILANGITIASGLTLTDNGNGYSTLSYTIPQNNGYLALPTGQVQLTVVYSGYTISGSFFGIPIDWVTLGAVSVTKQITISSDTTNGDFSLQSDTTVNQGAPLLASTNTTSATYNLRLTSLYNYTGSVSLSCSVVGYSKGGVRSAPAGLACSLGSSSVSLSSGFGTTTLTAKAATNYVVSSNTMPASPASRWWMAAGSTTLACLFLFGLPGERRKWQSMLTLSVLMIIGFGITGCGATFGTSSQSQATEKLNGGATSNAGTATTAVPAGTYTVMVTATGTLSNGNKVTHTLPVEVLVGTTN